jgi:hypothetical protein
VPRDVIAPLFAALVAPSLTVTVASGQATPLLLATMPRLASSRANALNPHDFR